MDLPVLIGSGHTVASFYYESADPYAVTLRVIDGAGPVQWVFARDLFAEALDDGRAGVGDVAVTVRGDLVVLGLSSPHGTGTAVFRRADVATFMASTHEIVRPGSESVWLDWSDVPGVNR
ncbi:SsgA family sporulation/cell division regulator [Amycolatopsis sp. K13G38]|uniref:SsgA family sporulation/cell division regulator n=1 Tax=Amycolatopsis acididurans TaxID=2724524 RepID=A0ABX1J5G5_9PSEU|nr:SsgA family sporulation/cell division regulator [Amycolatopsis acididurans]NKQ54988.1 SsgA family sporulation/cell division regulator [Amycolatopsis acididurans]